MVSYLGATKKSKKGRAGDGKTKAIKNPLYPQNSIIPETSKAPYGTETLYANTGSFSFTGMMEKSGEQNKTLTKADVNAENAEMTYENFKDTCDDQEEYDVIPADLDQSDASTYTALIDDGAYYKM